MWKKWTLSFLVLALCAFLGTAVPAEAAAKEKPARVELVMVLDKSGSMSGLESDTIGGFNSMIEKEKKLDAKVNVTTVLFNDKIDTIYNREDIRRIKPLTAEDTFRVMKTGIRHRTVRRAFHGGRPSPMSRASLSCFSSWPVLPIMFPRSWAGVSGVRCQAVAGACWKIFRLVLAALPVSLSWRAEFCCSA